MKQLSVTSFLEVVERSGLVDKDRLNQSLADLEREAGVSAITDSQVVSSHLTDVGLLTGWQRQRLLEGRAAGFFVGKYKLLDHLGTGGMSSVYLAEHIVMRRRVAIKVLPSSRVNDTSYLARFHREARAVAALDHPNIVRAFDVDNDGDVHYLVMEYVEGKDIKVLVERNGPLPYLLAADIIRQAADGLSHAHKAGLIHRDMKPANLLLDGHNVVKVLDMGLARFATDDVDASLTNDHDEKMLGTVDYLAPEQALDSHLVDPRADIYSLGCTLYFTLMGTPPFPNGTLAQRVVCHATKEPADITQKRPDVPRELLAICRRMMAKSPERRYQSADDVSRALVRWAQSYREQASQPVAAFDEELTLAPLDEHTDKMVSDSSKVVRLGKTATSVGSGDSVNSAASVTKDSDSSKSPRSSASGSGRLIKPTASDSSKTTGTGSPATGKPSARPSPGQSIPAIQSPRSTTARPIGPDRPKPKEASAFDDLLAEVAPKDALSPLGMEAELVGGAALSAGSALGTHSLRGRRASRWDSPWFLMGVGTLLAMAVIAVAVVCYVLLK